MTNNQTDPDDAAQRVLLRVTDRGAIRVDQISAITWHTHTDTSFVRIDTISGKMLTRPESYAIASSRHGSTSEPTNMDESGGQKITSDSTPGHRPISAEISLAKNLGALDE